MNNSNQATYSKTLSAFVFLRALAARLNWEFKSYLKTSRGSDIKNNTVVATNQGMPTASPFAFNFAGISLLLKR